jgi:hypothetical protein
MRGVVRLRVWTEAPEPFAPVISLKQQRALQGSNCGRIYMRLELTNRRQYQKPREFMSDERQQQLDNFKPAVSES